MNGGGSVSSSLLTCTLWVLHMALLVDRAATVAVAFSGAPAGFCVVRVLAFGVSFLVCCVWGFLFPVSRRLRTKNLAWHVRVVRA